MIHYTMCSIYKQVYSNTIYIGQVYLNKLHKLYFCEQFCSIFSQTSKLYQEKSESEKEETEKVMAALQETLTSTQMKITNLTMENNKLKKQFAEETASLHKTVEILTSEAKGAVKRAELCVEKEKRASEICEEQKTLAVEVSYLHYMLLLFLFLFIYFYT